MTDRIPGAQQRSWILAAAIPPLLSVAGRNEWIAVALLTVVCAILCYCVISCVKSPCPKWLCAVEIAWIVLLLGGFAKTSAACWAEVDGFPVVPIVLIFLCALSAQCGAMHAARTGATLLWFTLPVLAIVALAGLTDLEPGWIQSNAEIPDGTLTGILLLPCVVAFLPLRSAKTGRWLGLILGVVAVGAALLMQGTMGTETAKNAANSFYEFSKGVTLFGVAERFESLIACALTIGWFALYSLLLSAIWHLTERICKPLAKWSVWICAGIGIGFMYILPDNSVWIGIGCLLFWGFLPVLTQGIVGGKNIEKK